MRSGLGFAGLILLAFASPGAAAADITPTTVPAHVYRLRDPGRAPAESWLFHLVVTDAQRRELRPVRAELELFSGTTLRETMALPESTVLARRAPRDNQRGFPERFHRSPAGDLPAPVIGHAKLPTRGN